MNIKIQGGGNGKYANTGSSFGVLQYLNHENDKRIADKKQIELFFDQKGQEVDFATAVNDLDQNKAKLMQKDAKFFCLTISPSEKEQSLMGNTEAEQSQAMKDYTREIMDEYAKNFGKGLRGEDLLYYAKIHHNREEKEGMHAHVIVSRKSRNNKVRLSPKTNHRKQSGKVSGFDRTHFFSVCEDSFDVKFNYERDYSESFEYQNALKNGNFKEKEAAVKQAEITPKKALLLELKKERLRQEHIQSQELRQERQQKNKHQEQSMEKGKNQNKGFSMGL